MVRQKKKLFRKGGVQCRSFVGGVWGSAVVCMQRVWVNNSGVRQAGGEGGGCWGMVAGEWRLLGLLIRGGGRVGGVGAARVW